MQTIELMSLAKEVLLFLFGTPHETMYAAMTLTIIGTVIEYVRTYDPPKSLRKITEDVTRNILAYLAFIVIAVRLDAIAVEAMFGWDGATQSLSFLFIVSREIKVILDYIRSRGIEIPHIIETRTKHIEKIAQGKKEENNPDPKAIDEKIRELKAQIAEIEEQRQSNTNDGGEDK